MKKRIFSLFLAVCIIFTILPDLLLPASAKAAPDIRVEITENDGKVSWGEGDDLSEAVSGTVAGAVYSIEVTYGEITTADWNYIKGNRASFSSLRSFTVADAVYTVADMPSGSVSYYPYAVSLFPDSIQSISIPNVTAIGDYAFWQCENLTDADLTDVIDIGYGSFNYCISLTDINIPNAETIRANAFQRCRALGTINIPAVEIISNYAFDGCIGLTALNLPSAETIGEYAFYNCTSLITLKLPEVPPTVQRDAFAGCPETRRLVFVDANGDELTGDALDDAGAAYKADDDGSTEDNLWYGWVIPLDSISLDIGDGDIEASAGPNSVIGVKQAGSLVGELPQNGMITITGTTDTNKIVVDGVYANVTLDNISIDVSGSDTACAFELKNNANADLTLSGNNSLTSGVTRAGMKVAEGESITIRGTDEDFLTARTGIGANKGGAGIGGGGYGEPFSETDGGTINIYGGNITATGSNWSAGIGGGNTGKGGIINIFGGNVTATGSGSGIGGGPYAEGGTINISGGNVTATGGASGIGGGYNNGSESNPACDAYITIMAEATVKASSEYSKYEAISAMNGALEAGSTARILMANFSEEQSSGTATEVFNEVYGDTPVSSITPVTLNGEDYLSAAFTLPEGTYNLKAAGNLQQYTNTGAPTGIDFVIPDTAGIYIFDEVEDAPVLTFVSISGTAQVGQTLTAAVSPSAATASYQWKADSTDITGATGNTYIPVTADIGKAITVTATATGEWFGTVTSSPTSTVLAAPTNNNGGNGGKKDNVRDRKPATGLPYYMKDGKKVFIGFSATGEYIVPEGVTVLFGENPKGFTDIENHWAKSGIEFVTEREIFQGMDENSFGPEISMTRGMFVTVIGRLYERSYGSIAGNTAFSDVDPGAYYSGYVAWAHENGIIQGIGGDMFDPEVEISHEQMAAIMFRFAKFLGKGPQGNWMINVTYPDSADISDWAMESAAYCQLTGIITGGDGGKFAPKAIATRAEVAVVIERFINEMLK